MYTETRKILSMLQH